MFVEVWQEVWHEVTHEPLAVVIELAQFAILVLIIKLVALGTRNRRGVVVNMLGERKERVRRQLEEAAAHEREAAEAPARAKATAQLADEDRRVILAEAERHAATERERILAEADEQAAEIERQAADTLEHERAEVLGGVRDVLVDIVARATRQVLDEGYSPAEQREMIQSAIIASIDDLESVSIS